MCVYAKPRYFNAKGREELREGIRSAIRKLSRRLTRKGSSAPQNQAHETKAKSPTPVIPAANILTTKSSLESISLFPMETEVVPFGAPDAANAPDFIAPDVQSQMVEPETIPFGAPNPIDEPGIATSPSNTPDSVKQQSGFRIRSKLLVLSRLFSIMDHEETTDAGLADKSPSNDQQDVLADNEEVYEMLLAG
jgi:hypothetical protein